MYLTWAGAPGKAGNVNHGIMICMLPAGGSPDHAVRFRWHGPLLPGSPAEVGKGCPRHVVVLWPRLSPHPQLAQISNHTQDSSWHHLLRQMWPWLWDCTNLPARHPGAPVTGHLRSSGLAAMEKEQGTVVTSDVTRVWPLSWSLDEVMR